MYFLEGFGETYWNLQIRKPVGLYEKPNVATHLYKLMPYMFNNFAIDVTNLTPKLAAS